MAPNCRFEPTRKDSPQLDRSVEHLLHRLRTSAFRGQGRPLWVDLSRSLCPKADTHRSVRYRGAPPAGVGHKRSDPTRPQVRSKRTVDSIAPARLVAANMNRRTRMAYSSRLSSCAVRRTHRERPDPVNESQLAVDLKNCCDKTRWASHATERRNR
jgi:hypothetical protein